MRIGATGAGGAGKTTTMLEVATLLDLTFHEGVARKVFRARNLTEADQHAMTPEQRLELQMEILECKIAQDLETPIGVFDRTALDHYAYCLYRCQQAMDDRTYEHILKLTQANLRRYRLIFYFPKPHWKDGSDGMREGGEAYTNLIDSIILGSIAQWNRPGSYRVHMLEPGTTIDWRAQHIVDTIRRELSKD